MSSMPCRRDDLIPPAIVLGALMLAACGETTVSAPLPAGSIAVISGAVPSGTVGRPLPDPIIVRVLGTDDQPLAGAQVSFTVSADGTVSPATATTGDDGLATTRWTLGPAAGTATLTAAAGTDASTSITVSAKAGPPASVAAVAGNNQTAPAGTAVGIPPSVRVVDSHGNPVEGAAVSYAVLSGGGTVTDALRRTSAQGLAVVGSWILGPAGGTQQLTARVEESGVANNPVLFTATATPRIPASMVATAGDNQTGQVNRLVAVAPAVRVTDNYGDPLPGIVVTFAVTSGGGSVVGASQVTDPAGKATVGGWFLGGAPGPNTLTASVTGLSPVTFTATAEAGQPASVVAYAGNAQVGIQGQPVPVRPAVRVVDATGNPVAGVSVIFEAVQGGGTVTDPTQATNATGIATVGNWILGSGAPNSLRATVTGTGISGNPVTFAAQSAQAIAITSAPAGPLSLGANFSIVVRLQDALNAPVPYSGSALTISIASGGGTLNGTLTQLTNISGVATFVVNVTGTAGAYTFKITGTGLLSATTASITFN